MGRKQEQSEEVTILEPARAKFLAREAGKDPERTPVVCVCAEWAGLRRCAVQLRCAWQSLAGPGGTWQNDNRISAVAEGAVDCPRMFRSARAATESLLLGRLGEIQGRASS